MLRQAGVDAGLVTNFTNVTYLTGFTGDDSYLLVTRSDQILISDTRYQEQLQEECPGLDLEIRRSGVKMLDSIRKVVAKAKVGSLAVEAGSMTKDLAILIGPDQPWLTTNQFLDKLDQNLQAALS